MLFTFESRAGEFGAPATGIAIAGGAAVGVPRINNIRGWQDQLNAFGEWLDRLQHELAVPDLWTAISHSDTAIFGIVADESIDNTLFTDGEREDIRKALVDLKADVTQSFALTADDLTLLDAGVAKLIDDSQYIGRKDWLLLFIGVMVSVAVGAAIPHLLPALLSAFHHIHAIFQPPPLSLPPE